MELNLFCPGKANWNQLSNSIFQQEGLLRRVVPPIQLHPKSHVSDFVEETGSALQKSLYKIHKGPPTTKWEQTCRGHFFYFFCPRKSGLQKRWIVNGFPWLGFCRLKGGDFANSVPWLGFCRLKGGDFANSFPWLGFCRDGNHDSVGDGKGF